MTKKASKKIAPKKRLVSLTDMLISRNKEQSAIFASPDAALWRRKYRAEHPTEIAAFKCMDGRLNLPVMTETPPGIIVPFRNLGGQFDLGWPFLGSEVRTWVDYAISRGRSAIPLVTYHFSKGDVHRGCKGFSYDTKAAKAFTENLRKQFEKVFGKSHLVVYPVQVSIETDEDALIFHGEKHGEILDLSLVAPMIDIEVLRLSLERLYPTMPRPMVNDLLPIAMGNIRHIKEVRESARPIEQIDHQEQVLAIGRGFDWLHLPNKALIVGPYSPDLSKPIGIAAGLLLDNIQKKRVPASEGVVVMSAAGYRDEAGPERLMAEEKARSLARLTLEVIHDKVPELAKYMKLIVGVTNLNTRKYTEIDMPK